VPTTTAASAAPAASFNVLHATWCALRLHRFIALVLIVSAGRPLLLPRFLAWMAVPLCVLARWQLMVAGRARVDVLLSLVAVFGFGLFTQITTPGTSSRMYRALESGSSASTLPATLAWERLESSQ
jgi:hypothetical protein